MDRQSVAKFGVWAAHRVGSKKKGYSKLSLFPVGHKTVPTPSVHTDCNVGLVDFHVKKPKK